MNSWIALALAVIAVLAYSAIVAGAAVIWGLGVALLTSGVLPLVAVIFYVLYDPDKA